MSKRKTLTCLHCGIEYTPKAPADKFDQVTLENCDFPDYDVSQPHECDNCHNINVLFWHDTALERKHLLEHKEFLYYKTKALSENLTMFVVNSAMVYHAAEALTTEKQFAQKILGSIENREDFQKLEQAVKKKMEPAEQFSYYAREFYLERKRSMLSQDEIDRMDAEQEEYLKQWIHDFLGWLIHKFPNTELADSAQKLLETGDNGGIQS